MQYSAVCHSIKCMHFPLYSKEKRDDSQQSAILSKTTDNLLNQQVVLISSDKYSFADFSFRSCLNMQ